MNAQTPTSEFKPAIEAAREILLDHLEPIEHEAAELRKRLITIEQTREQIEAALKALTPGKRAKGKASQKPAKPFAKKADVHAVCLALVDANAPIAKADLESLAKHKLGEDMGFNLSGVSLRLSECLGSDAFVITPDEQVSLTSAAAAPGVKSGS